MGFEKMFPQERFTFEGVSVSSDVSNQPMTSDEALRGARNRSVNARLAVSTADYWVGIEGGVEKVSDGMSAFAWVVVANSDKFGKGKTGTFFLPQKIADLVATGMELGEADDVVFGRTNSKQANGAVGLLTSDVIVRASFYSEAVILALIPFKNPSFY